MLELAELEGRPRGPQDPDGDPGMLDVGSFPARCHACGWRGSPTTVGCMVELSCPRCQLPGEQGFGKRDELGVDLAGVAPSPAPMYRPRRIGRVGRPYVPPALTSRQLEYVAEKDRERAQRELEELAADLLARNPRWPSRRARRAAVRILAKSR